MLYRFPQQSSFVSSGNATSDQLSSGSIIQLSRVQNVTIDIKSPRAEETYLNEISENVLVRRPVVDVSFEYLATAGYNERNIGFVTDGFNSAFWLLNNEKNFYFQSEETSVDANLPNNSPKVVLGVGHVLLNSYSISANVGALLQATYVGEGLNAELYALNTGQNIPAIDFQTAERVTGIFALPVADQLIGSDDTNTANNVIALGAKDLIMEFPSGSVFASSISGDGCLLQGFNLSFSVNRVESTPLGYAYPNQRRMQSPIHVTLSAEAVLNQYYADQLRLRNCYDSGYDINILVKQPCSDLLALELKLRGLKLESQQFHTSIEGFETVSFSWNAVIGDLNSSGANVFMKAYNGTPYFIINTYKAISGASVGGDYGFIEQVTFERRIVEGEFFSGQVT